VSVPNVVGKSKASAQSTLKDKKFKVSSSSQYSESVASGKVITQSPAAGTEVVEGSTVSIVVSKGSEMVEVPDVIGSTETEARQTIESKGLDVKVTYEPHADNTLVIRQDPESPTKVKLGTTVTIIVDAVEP